MNTRILVAALSTVALAGCTDSLSLSGMGEAAVTLARSSGSPVLPSSSSQGNSRSVSSDTVESFMVTVTAIQFLESGASASDASGWTTLHMGHAARVNLMALPQEGVSAQVIASGHVAAGSYRRVRLIVSSPTIRFKGDVVFGLGTSLQGGVDYDVQIGSSQAGIEAAASFVVEASSDSGSSRANIGLLFDAGSTLATVSLAGNGDVVITPVVREDN